MVRFQVKVLTGKYLNPRPGQAAARRPPLLSVLSQFLFDVFAVKDIPFAAAGWNMTREGLDFTANGIVDRIFPLKKVMQRLLRFREGAPLIVKSRQAIFAQTIDDQVR
jgi:hypothetical protein